MDDFPEALDRCLRQVPAGHVATCGAIASALGDVRAARSVAVWILEHPGTPGAHRVVRADGRPTIRVSFPSFPTYLAYREFPGIQAAVQRLSSRPDVLMVDGHGRLYPARFGIACDVGIRLDISTIGIAKHRLAGRPAVGIPRVDGAISMELDGRTLGYAWTPPGRAKPIFISIGSRISLEKAMHIVRAVTPHGYPEPLKLADRIGKEMKRNEKREKGAEQ